METENKKPLRKFRVVLCELITSRRVMSWEILAEDIDKARWIGKERYLKDAGVHFIGAESI